MTLGTRRPPITQAMHRVAKVAFLRRTAAEKHVDGRIKKRGKAEEGGRGATKRAGFSSRLRMAANRGRREPVKTFAAGNDGGA